MKKQIVIIEPHGVAGNVFANYMRLPLLGPIYLGTILKQAGHDVKILNENILGRQVTMSEIDADVCCVSAITPTVERGYEILRQYKAIRPQGMSLIGGAHASSIPEEASTFADYVVQGEGEQVVLDLINYGADSKIISGPRVSDLDTLPVPDFSLLAGADRMRVIPVMTSRGCPYNCNFCSVTQMFGNHYRTHSVDRVIEEIQKYRGQRLFIYDDNFTASPSRVRKILERILSENIKLQWSAQVRADSARYPELVEMMSRAGCRYVYVGFESISNETLNSMNKHQTKEDIIRAIEVFHRFNIQVHGMFILGSDEDALDIAEDTVRFCRSHRIDSVQFMILTPFPGTPLFRKMEAERRILHKRWAYYDGMHTVFQPKKQTPAELQATMMQAFNDFYSLGGALIDGLNAVADGFFRAPSVLGGKIKNLSFLRSVTKLSARRIMRQWLNANSDYLAWISRISIRNTSFSQNAKIESLLLE